MSKDIRLSIGFLDHPKTIKLEKRLGFEGIKCLLWLWEFAAQRKPKGLLDGMTVEDIAIAAKWQQGVERFVDTLLTLRWLDVDEETTFFKIHDWEEHQGFIFFSEERRLSAKRAGKISAQKRAMRANPQQGVEHTVQPKGSTPSPSPSPSPSPFKNTYAHFEKFWVAYPKKKSKGDAEKAFNAIKPSEQLLETMLSTIGKAKTSEDWIKEGGKFIPYPATWLRAKGWEDEYMRMEPNKHKGAIDYEQYATD